MTQRTGPGTSSIPISGLAAEGGSRSSLQRLLEGWRSHLGAEAVAFYRDRQGGFERALVCGEPGEDPFPHEGPDDARCTSRIEVPGGVLVARGGSESASEVPLVAVALEALLRAEGLDRELKQHRFQARFRGVELEALYEVGLSIAATLDLDQLAENVLLQTVSLLDARRGALYLRENDRYVLRQTFGGSALEELPADGPLAEELLAMDDNAEPPEGLLPEVRHALAVEVGERGGVLVVGDKESRHGIGPFQDEDRRTVSLFANQSAIAIENARLHRHALEAERLGREMELAAEIQGQILPDRLPEVAGLEMSGWNRPARQVGGDYYDLVLTGEGRLGMAVGDVTGKGMPAALMVSTLHSSLALLRDRSDLGPRMVERLNHHVYESSASNKFITMIVAEIDATSGNLLYVNAGHNPGMLVRTDGSVEHLTSGGLPLGLMPGGRYQARSIVLEPGDLLCLYSDGITECAAPDDEEFGEDRLERLLGEQRDVPLEEILQTIEGAVDRFGAGLPQGDDQTVVLVRRRRT
ncbi:MAG: SpoIIE family protein phosphatase [Acidobacteriota bacterium]